MRIFVALGALVVSLSALAEPTTLPIDGMHCGGCAAMIEKKVCAEPGLKTCKASSTGNNMGKLEIEMADGSPVDKAKISKLVSEAGQGDDKYTVITEEAAQAKAKAKPSKKKHH